MSPFDEIRARHEVRSSQRAVDVRAEGLAARTFSNLAKKNNLNFNSLETVLENLRQGTKKSSQRALKVYKRALKKYPDDDIKQVVTFLEGKLNPSAKKGAVVSNVKKMRQK